MGLYNNVPTFTYVSASGITVTYNKEVYTVQSFYTNKKYIYWDYDNATVLQASNTMPTRSFKTHLVIINDNGIATLVPSTYEGFEISFSGDSDEAIKSRIYALYEKNKELGDKYVAIEQDIEGIKQIVGSGGSGGSGNSDVIDRVSKIEQTAEKIELSVNEMQRTYADNEEMDKLREDLNSAIIELNSDLGTLNSEMSDCYKDNEITYEEKIGIEEGIALIVNSKSEVLKYVNKVILICEEDNQNENLIALNSGISALENAHENLVRNITVAISDSVITPSEKTVIIDGFAKYNLRINELKNTCDEIIFLGVGGVVSEKLAQITMNSNEIRLSVSSVESSMTSKLSLQKAELEGQINDVSSQLGSFKDTVETTFKDGILDEAEKKLLEEKLSLLEKEKLDVDAQYEAIYNDEYLVEPYKQTLKDEYNRYASKHSELKAKINEVIKHEKVTESDLLAVKTLFNDCSSLLASLNVYLNSSLDVIATGKSNKEILAAKNELLKELEETNSKIDDIMFDIGDFVGDGLVDEAEKKAIELSLQSLEKEKLDIDAQYNYWYSNSYLVNPLKSEYKNAYDNYVLKYNNSVDIITGIANKTELVSDTDRENMLNAHKLLASALESFVEKANQVIEFVSQKQSEALKSDLQGEIDDINNKLGDLDLVIDGTFEDNIIDKTERKILAQNLSDLELQKIDVTEQYDQLYKSLYLDGTLKTQFKTSYDNFISKYNILISNIQDVLEKTELINDTDRENVNKAQSNLNESFGNFVSKSNEVIEYISKKQSDESIGNFNNELKDLNDKVDSILDDVSGALGDDVLDKAERKILEDGLNDLEVQKNDVVVQYENTYNNENLTDTTVKNNLKNSYNNFISKYNALVDNIRYLLNKSGDITDDNRLSYKNAYDEYKSSVILFTESFYAANNSITDKSMNDLKSTFNAEISELNNAINNLDETMNGIFKDGILSEAEKVSIREQLTILEREKVDVDNNHNSVYSNSSLSSSVKTSLKSSYDSYVLSYNSLVNIINSILNKTGIISSTEQTSYKNALVSYKGALGSYTSKLRSAIDNITNNSINAAKKELSDEIDDVIKSLGDLEKDMNEVFKDGVLSEAEKTTIKQQLETLKKEKGDIDKQYTALYNNKSLVDTTSSKPKSELKTAYDNFVSKYNSLVTTINTIVAKTTIVDDTDRNKLNTALSNYRTASSNYITKATNAIDAIASKKAADESEKVNEKYADIILGENGIVNVVGEVQSELKQTNSKIDNLEIGGRNLLLKTGDEKTITGKNTTNQCTNLYTLVTYKGDLASKNLTLSFTYTVSNYAGGTFVIQSYSSTYNNWGTITPSGNGTFTYSKTLTSGSAFNSNNGIQIRMDNFNGTVVISKMKLEKSNKPSDWTPASEDVEGTVTTLTERVQKAESTLSKDGLTTIIGNHYTTTTDIDGILDKKSYATTSEVQQTAESLTAKFGNSGGYNILRNSSGQNGVNHWVNSNLTSFTSNTDATQSNIALTSAKARLDLGNSTTSEKYAFSHRFTLSPNKTYTISGKYYVGDGSKGLDLHLLISNSITSTGNSSVNSYDTSVNCVTSSSYTGKWVEFSKTYTTGSSAKTGVIRIDNNGSNTNGTTKYTYFADLMITEGEVSLPWTPHPSEVYDGITTIDKDGIKVSQSNYSGYTQMKSDGFYVNNGSENVISVTSSGATFKGKVTIQSGSTVPTGTLSGTISNTQLAQEVKDSISNAQSTANTAKDDAATANSKLSEMANDNKLTASEKQSTKLEWDKIVGEKDKIVADATKYSQSTTNYVNMYDILNSYITPLLSNLTTTSDITGTTFRKHFTNYYNARQDLLNAISTKAKSLSDNAQTSANNAKNTADAAKNTADSAKSTADAAKNTADATNKTVNDNKVNWTNAYNRVNDWAYSAVTGTTTIDGALIQTDTITAKHIALGDFTNYVSESANATFTGEKGGNVNGYKVSNLSSGSVLHNSNISNSLYNIKGGEQFRVSARIKTGASTPSAGLYLTISGHWRNSSGTSLSSSSVSITTGTTDYSWVTLDKILTVPSKPTNASYFRFAIQLGTQVGTVYLENFNISKMTSAELIVDGAITASKLHADAINGKTITGNTITGATISGTEVTGGTISGTSITGGTFNSTNDVFKVLTDGTVETDDINVSGTVSTDVLTVNKISNSKYQEVLDQATTVYINSSVTSADEFYHGAKFSTFKDMLAVAPRNLNGYTLDIVMQTNIYENVSLTWFHSGQVDISFQGYTLYGYLYCYGASMVYRVYGGLSDDSKMGKIMPSCGRLMGSYYYALAFQYCQFAVNNIGLYPDTTNTTNSGGICANRGARGNIFNATAYGSMRYLVRAEYGSHVYVSKTSGTCNNATFCGTTGSIISINNDNTQAGRSTTGNPYWVGSGAMIVNNQLLGMSNITFGTTANSGSNTNTSTGKSETITETITASLADTYRLNVYTGWKKDGTVRQGDYGYGDCIGCWFFDNKLYSVMNKGTVNSVSIKITRQSGGTYGNVTHTLKVHNHTTRPSGQPTMGSTLTTFPLAVGSSATITFKKGTHDSIISALKSAKGLGLQSTYSSAYYSVCSGTITVKVTYTI